MEIDSGLSCLLILARLHGVPADAGQLKHQFACLNRAFSETDLLRAAKLIGLKSRVIRSEFSDLSDIPLPAIARNKNNHYFIIAGFSNAHALVQIATEQAPKKISEAELKEIWTGEIILISKRTSLLDVEVRFDFSWFIPAILKYKKIIAEVLLASFFIQLFALITPLFFQLVIDKVLVHRGLSTLDVLAAGLFMVILFDVVLNGLRNYVFAHTTNRIDVTLGSSLFNHLLKLPLAYFEARRVGDTVARVRELESIRNFITGSAITLIIDLLFTVVFFVVMYLYSPVLTWIVLATIPFYIILALFVTPVLRTRLNEKFNRGAENQAFLVESVNGIETIKSSALEPQNRKRWDEQLAAYVHASFRANNVSNVANQIATFINKITILLILWFGARLVIAGELSVGQLVAFNMLSGRVSGPVLRLAQLWQEFQQAGISVKRLGDILNAKPEPGHGISRASLPDLKGNVSFEQIVFRYKADGNDVLKSLSLHVPSGKVVGIVGRSGSGKSTLTKLIQRLYVPQSGRVLIDGVDLALVDTVWLRRNIGVVLQENFLFNRSIRENIALSDPSIAMERVIHAAQMSGAHDFILEFSEGYDTLVGEHGCNLSGGQRQRIAIARALINNPKILIFDEATSALDYESESIVQENMRYICKGRTVFIIAHRLSSVRHADHIVVMDKGQIVEGGSEEELLQKQGYYSNLYQHQFAMSGKR